MGSWGVIQDAILKMAEIAWVCYVLTLAVAWHFRLLEKSILLSLMVWCVKELTTTWGTPFLYKLVSGGQLNFAGWYVVFISMNCLAISIIYFWHKSNKVKFKKLSVSIMGLLLAICFFHILRLLEWMLLNLEFSGTGHQDISAAFSQSFGSVFYRYGLMSLKFLAVFIFVKSLVSNKRSLA